MKKIILAVIVIILIVAVGFVCLSDKKNAGIASFAKIKAIDLLSEDNSLSPVEVRVLENESRSEKTDNGETSLHVNECGDEDGSFEHETQNDSEAFELVVNLDDIHSDKTFVDSKLVDLAAEYEWFMSLSSEDQEDFFDANFNDAKVFINWFHEREEAFAQVHPAIELDEGDVIQFVD